MKKILVTLLLVLSTMSCFARKVYCTVTLEDAEKGYYIHIDFGKETEHYYKVDGKPVIVRSTADLLNFMSEMGWEFIPTQKELIFFKEESSND